ncbi:hypothetical protein [Kitasatospora sp. NPDC087314]|uniref:nSTAND1 domain-containing NTPase n=1 Tax=Kitasatospora sp. NPDC087314 TaxID=3364068 RepID=UPI00381A1160
MIYGLRSDFYSPCAEFPQLRAALQDGQILVGPMGETSLREAILSPARAVGLEIEPGLVELLLRDLGTPAPHGAGSGASTDIGAGMVGVRGAGRLPLLAHALRTTWQQKHGTALTVEGYQATGGIAHAVAATAERLFTSLDLVGQQVVRTRFLRLVKIGDDGEHSRLGLPYTDLLNRSDNPAVAATVIDAFTRARLLTREQGSVAITHEVLLRAWRRLHQWIDTDRAGHVLRQELEEAASAWIRSHRDGGLLYRGSRLEAAKTWTNTPRADPVNPTVSAFLAASTRQGHRAVRLRHTVTALLAALALVASGAAAIAFQQRGTVPASLGLVGLFCRRCALSALVMGLHRLLSSCNRCGGQVSARLLGPDQPRSQPLTQPAREPRRARTPAPPARTFEDGESFTVASDPTFGVPTC